MRTFEGKDSRIYQLINFIKLIKKTQWYRGGQKETKTIYKLQ